MKIILSPAKQMKIELGKEYLSTPIFIVKANELHSYLSSLSFDGLKKIYKASDKIVEEGRFYLSNFDNNSLLSPSIYSYDGIAFTYLEVNSLNEDDINYLNDHLFILSGLYGIVKPLDGINRYRLEMGSKINFKEYKNLYNYWKDTIYKEIYKDNDIIINLASEEYASVIRKHLKGNDKFVDVMFYELDNDKLVEKGSTAKWLVASSLAIWQLIKSITLKILKNLAK